MLKLEEFFRFFRFMIKLMPMLFIGLTILLTIREWISPWPSAAPALKRFGSQLSICVGESSPGISIGFADVSGSGEQRSYLLVPHVFTSPELITVSVDAETGELKITSSTRGFALTLAALVGFGFLTWYWWVRPIREGGREALRLAIEPADQAVGPRCHASCLRTPRANPSRSLSPTLGGLMKRALQILALVLVGLLFGLSFTCIDPYPFTYTLVIWCAASLLFLGIGIVLRSTEARVAWEIYGLTTFVCFLIIQLWYWQGSMERGWWYPPQLPIVQQFYFVDGEAGYDAEVGNFFLVIWFLVTALFLGHQLRARSRRRQASTRPAVASPNTGGAHR